MWSQIFHWQEKAFSPQYVRRADVGISYQLMNEMTLSSYRELCKYRPQKEAGFLSKLSQGLHHHPDRRIDVRRV